MGSARGVSIWWWAFGYFAAYAPYSLLTKALSDGKLGPKVTGEAILPLSSLSSLVAMVLFLGFTGWWRSASTWKAGGLTLPRPTRWTFLSGLCGATILTTTTLAYTFEGVSIVFMMLLMRGGVLVMAPIVDAISGRKVQPKSFAALGLTVVALVVASAGRVSLDLSLAAGIDVSLYLAAYFVRLRFMSHLAKSESADVTRRYFVEEQLVSTPAAFLALGLLGLSSAGALGEAIRTGFTDVPFSSQAAIVVLIGVLSQGTGVFGALVLLDKSENSFSVPVNRASSVLAGVLASLGLWAFLDGKLLPWSEWAGAAIVIGAIVVLSWPSKPKAQAPPPAAAR